MALRVSWRRGNDAERRERKCEAMHEGEQRSESEAGRDTRTLNSTLLHVPSLGRSFCRMTTPSVSTTLREYDVNARTTDVFGRVLCGIRDHHFIIDGPFQNGCPGEEITPVEVFLSAVAACGVELIHVIARDQQIPLRTVAVSIHGTSDRTKQTRTDVSTLNTVQIDLRLSGADDAQAAALVEGFKRR
jgi:uncharacterized OsmC-like protein